MGCDAFHPKECWVIYQRAMNIIFYDLMGWFMEVYINDKVIKARYFQGHIDFLMKIFQRMRVHQLKMNPQKCMFGISACHFLDFLIHQKRIEINKNKANAIIVAKLLEDSGRGLGSWWIVMRDVIHAKVVLDNICYRLGVCCRSRATTPNSVSYLSKLVCDTVCNVCARCCPAVCS